jgi:hypothetical protein
MSGGEQVVQGGQPGVKLNVLKSPGDAQLGDFVRGHMFFPVLCCQVFLTCFN